MRASQCVRGHREAREPFEPAPGQTLFGGGALPPGPDA
jgi:hypothetical protein